MKNITRIILLTMMTIALTGIIIAQTDEASAYQNASGIADQSKKIEALQEFVSRYPNGKLLQRAYNALYQLYADQGKENDALKYAALYIESYPEASRMNVYNGVAYTLAEKKIGLKAAAVYAQKAVDMARNASPRSLKMILDTQAFVLYNLGDADSALVLEREAAKGNEDDPTYMYFLSVYEEATGHRMDALTHSAQAILDGDPGQAMEKFNEWLRKEKSTAEEQDALKASIVRDIVSSYTSNEPAGSMKNSVAAGFMAKMNVDLSKATSMAEAAAAAAGDDTPIDQAIALKTNLAMVENAANEPGEALDALESVKMLASPYDGDFWNAMGKAYERMNKPDKALDSYVQGLIAYENPTVKSSADALIASASMDPDVLVKKIAETKDRMTNFDPGKNSEKNSTGKTVLAELFTGAECGPCVAADHAFDKLSEYYTRNDLVILEYHVHIPGPDPMTNPDTYQRYVYYGGSFGTPTVFFNGIEKLTGGGGNIVSANRFLVYKYLIGKSMKQSPEMSISGTAGLKSNNMIAIALDVKPSTAMNDNSLSMHVALVEKSIAYTGANGISKHLFVVRHLVNGAEGVPISLADNDVPYATTIDFSGVKKEISTYLDDPSKDKSWRAPSFSGWRERTDTIDPSNLAVVAWVQDNTTKEVLQSFYVDVLKDVSAK